MGVPSEVIGEVLVVCESTRSDVTFKWIASNQFIN